MASDLSRAANRIATNGMLSRWEAPSPGARTAIPRCWRCCAALTRIRDHDITQPRTSQPVFGRVLSQLARDGARASDGRRVESLRAGAKKFSQGEGAAAQAAQAAEQSQKERGRD